MVEMILTSKTLHLMGSKVNEANGSQISLFAKKQMEKYGWKE